MKKLILAAAALMVSLAAYGQGQVVINNRVGTEVTARLVSVSDTGTTSSIGSPDWTVNFFGGPTGTAVTALKPLDPTSSTMRGAAGTAAAGYFNGVTATVPGVDVSGKADVILVLHGPNNYSQTFGPYTATLGGGTITPPNLPLGTANLVVNNVPEPTTLALGALGLGALLVIRRRK
jgi:MYXO-CTERM domain-containing protein